MAISIVVAVVRIDVALVDIDARDSVAVITSVAVAGEGTSIVVTGCIVIASVGTSGTFIDVIAVHAASGETADASACE